MIKYINSVSFHLVQLYSCHCTAKLSNIRDILMAETTCSGDCKSCRVITWLTVYLFLCPGRSRKPRSQKFMSCTRVFPANVADLVYYTTPVTRIIADGATWAAHSSPSGSSFRLAKTREGGRLRGYLWNDDAFWTVSL